MHFLSHYYTELPNENPLLVAALSIPDLTRGFTRVYNSNLKKQLPPEQEGLKKIHEGIVQHYAGDFWFHKSPLFKEHISLAMEQFLKQKLSREKLRLSVIAHLAVELMLDRQIVLANEELCNRYYMLIEHADEKLIRQYFALHSLPIAGEDFLSKFHFWKQRRVLFLFKELENIVVGLDRVYGSVTKTAFTEEEKRKFLSALHNIDSVMRYSWQEILKDKQ